MKDPAGSGNRILVCDDEELLLEMYRDILCPGAQGAGEPTSELERLKARLFPDAKKEEPPEMAYEVTFCRQAEEAVDAVRQAVEAEKPFSVVFMDVRMPPGPDGVWAAEEIRALDPNVQIVMVTGYSDVDPVEIGRRVSPPESLLYVQKPFHPPEIRQFALALSSKSESERRLRQSNAELEVRVEQRTRELESAYEELKKLDKMKDSFLSSVSHELRTPLTSIRSFSEILLQYEEVSSEERKEFLGIINSESERLTRLINDLLDLSRIEAGRMVWHNDVLSMEEVIRETVRAHQPLVAEKSLRADLEVPPDLPLLFADRDRIQQVLTNVLANAVKFSREGGTIRIRAEAFDGRRAGEPSRWIRVSVSDDGRGIAAENLESIFDKFRQGPVDGLTDKPTGTGLGLPICKEIIGYYGGNIWAESEIGAGSVFRFTLPATPVSAQSLEEPVQQDEKAGDREGKTILLVDDNRNMRRLLRYQLRKQGYRVLEAESGLKALEMVERESVDLICLDLMMPSMSGYELLGMLREDASTRDIPVLIISVVEDREKGLLMGASDFLTKPFREGDLGQRVRSLLGEEHRTVLIADDDPAVLEVLAMQLEEMGFTVQQARNGDEAITSLEASVPDLVILDVIMPGKNGYEVLRWIRNRPQTRHVPVVILSALPLAGQGDELCHLGIEGHVQKSSGLKALFERVDSILVRPED